MKYSSKRSQRESKVQTYTRPGYKKMNVFGIEKSERIFKFLLIFQKSSVTLFHTLLVTAIALLIFCFAQSIFASPNTYEIIFTSTGFARQSPLASLYLFFASIEACCLHSILFIYLCIFIPTNVLYRVEQTMFKRSEKQVDFDERSQTCIDNHKCIGWSKQCSSEARSKQTLTSEASTCIENHKCIWWSKNALSKAKND